MKILLLYAAYTLQSVYERKWEKERLSERKSERNRGKCGLNASSGRNIKQAKPLPLQDRNNFDVAFEIE